jgi:hypothetical protein
MKKAVVIIVLTIVYICGCRVSTEEGIQEVKNTILRYNQLLAEGYAKMNMTLLQEVATLDHATKVYHHMAALGEAKIRIESQLVGIEFLDTQFPKKDLARVKTREKWNYTHVNINTKMPTQTVVKGLIYNLSYDLVRKDGKWLVSSVSILEKKKPSEKKN